MPSFHIDRRTGWAGQIAPILTMAVVLATPSRLRSQVDADDEVRPAPSRDDINQLDKEYRAETDEKKRAALVTKGSTIRRSGPLAGSAVLGQPGTST
jgi:hypothetical protein